MANMTTSIVMQLVDRVTRPVRRIQQSLSGLGRRAGLDRLAGSARRVGETMGQTLERARGLGQRLAVMGGLAAGAVWGVERLVSGVTDVGNSVQESAERLSVGTTWLQEWMAVGRRFGVGNDALVDGLKELSMRADEFVVTAGGPAAEAFGRLGINVDDLRRTGGDTAAMFDLVRSRLGQLENDAARQRVMDEIFGGQGAEQMVAMLGATREEVEAIMRAAHERGEIFSPEDVEESRSYTRQMGALRQTLFGIQRTVVGELLPAINDWIERMGLLGQANREAVATDIVEGVRDVWRGVQMVGAAVSWAADRVGGFGNLIAILAAIMSARLLVAIGRTIIAIYNMGAAIAVSLVRILPALAGGLVAATRAMLGLAARAVPAVIAGIRAMSVAMLTTPIGWIITGIAAVAGAAYLIYRNWDGISAWFGELWEGVTEWFDQGIGGIVQDLLAFSPAGLLLQGIDAVFELFGARPLTEVGREWIGGLWDGITERWTALTGWLSQKIEELTGWLPDWAQERLGLGEMGAPQAGGAPVAEGRSGAMPGPGRTEVGGELRIVVDSEGRPRVAEARRDGALDFDVTSGALGVMP
ncbi:hypothetical protein [Halomonas saccharevitans]|uniref:Phage-related minor tail protein n=1 Tax=Halomonas saccharevitans TaxID=416872 RepID=A0A1I7AFP7_9GAMM|nr:hypothetical protein [Halomonas saccharevitans]SFT73767.1 hypothetical protein SAMN04487956_11746 [Halomonas saccharevitans]